MLTPHSWAREISQPDLAPSGLPRGLTRGEWLAALGSDVQRFWCTEPRLDTALHVGRLWRGVDGVAEAAAAVTVWVNSVSTAASLSPLSPLFPLFPTPNSLPGSSRLCSPKPSTAHLHGGHVVFGRHPPLKVHSSIHYSESGVP